MLFSFWQIVIITWKIWREIERETSFEDGKYFFIDKRQEVFIALINLLHETSCALRFYGVSNNNNTELEHQKIAKIEYEKKR